MKGRGFEDGGAGGSVAVEDDGGGSGPTLIVGRKSWRIVEVL